MEKFHTVVLLGEGFSRGGSLFSIIFKLWYKRTPLTGKPRHERPPLPPQICLGYVLNVTFDSIVDIFLRGKMDEFAFPKIGKRIGERIGKRARAAPCCARCTPRAALTRRASHAAAPHPCAQHHSACAGPRRRAAHRVPILKYLPGLFQLGSAVRPLPRPALRASAGAHRGACSSLLRCRLGG